MKKDGLREMNKKKAAAQMWWIIIGAVIALIVLIILMVMFTGKTRQLDAGLSDCDGKGGVCATTELGCPRLTLKSKAFDCPSEQFCCIGTPKECTNTNECGDYECSGNTYPNTKKYCTTTKATATTTS